MFYGKAIAGLIGLLSGGIFGLIIGVFIGHSFDRGLVRTFNFGSPENIERIKESFFATNFLLLGYLAKVDGRISKSEIAHAELVIAQMGLNSDQRKRAIEFFQRGSAAAFKVEPTVASFKEVCGSQKHLQQTMLAFLVSIALADEHGLVEAELNALQDIAGQMGFNSAQLQHLLAMAQAQGSFNDGSYSGTGNGNSLEDAYSALGVAQSVTDKELKRAYRKLMSQNHPDKLIAKGVPEEMIKIATGKSQKIVAAYDAISKHRAQT
ncbi:MAG: DnaJ like chaperone protein [Halioglobus sp.]|jgi:DnaJ like chaperone protein